MLRMALTIYVLLMFQFLLIAISMVLQSIFFINTSIFVFTIAALKFTLKISIEIGTGEVLLVTLEVTLVIN